MDFDMERMAVETLAFVLGRHMRQPVSRFNGKYLEYVHERNAPGGACAAPL